MGRRRSVEDWRREVYRVKDYTDRMGNRRPVSGSVKVLLLLMADHMRADRKVSVPRDVLAKQLGVHPQRVAERVHVAVEANLLMKVGGGWQGCTAEYQGIFPNPERVPERSTLHDPGNRYAITGESVPDGRYAITTADLSLTTYDRYVSNDEETDEHTADSLLAKASGS